MTHAVLKAEFLDFFDPSHRDEAKEARDKLLRGDCSMTQFPSVKKIRTTIQAVSPTIHQYARYGPDKLVPARALALPETSMYSRSHRQRLAVSTGPD